MATNPLRSRTRRHKVPPRGSVTKFFDTVVLPYDGDECLLWPFSDIKGYGQIRRNGRPQLVHRLVCEAHYGPPPTPAHHAAHSCGSGHLGCVAKRHIKWKTPSENEADKLAHGTAPRGEKCGTSKLTNPEVKAIRRLKELTGLASDTIAKSFNVSRRTVDRIVSRDIWTDI